MTELPPLMLQRLSTFVLEILPWVLAGLIGVRLAWNLAVWPPWQRGPALMLLVRHRPRDRGSSCGMHWRRLCFRPIGLNFTTCAGPARSGMKNTIRAPLGGPWFLREIPPRTRHAITSA